MQVLDIIKTKSVMNAEDDFCLLFNSYVVYIHTSNAVPKFGRHI